MLLTAKGKNKITSAKGRTYASSTLNERAAVNNKRPNRKMLRVLIEGTKNAMSVTVNIITDNAKFGFYNKLLGKNSYVSGKVINGVFIPNKGSKSYNLFLEWVKNYGIIEA